MSHHKRRYDHLRVRKNEHKRLMALLGKYPNGPAFDAAGNFVPNPPEVDALFDAQEARLIERTCSNGRCVVMWDPKQKQAAWSMGPAGCCDE